MPDRHQPRFLFPMLLLMIAVGVVSVALQLQQGREAALARAEQVEETTRLVEDLTDEFAGRSDQAAAQRDAICRIVHDIALEMDLAPPDCPPTSRNSDA